MIHFRKRSVPNNNATTETDYIEHNYIAISRTLAIVIVLLFIGCLLATGFLVYNLTSACKQNFEESTLIVYNKFTGNDITTTGSVQNVVDVDDDETTTIDDITTTTTTLTTTPTIDRDINVLEASDLRLPHSIRPHSYKIKLVPFIKEDNFTFHGEVTILINITSNSNNITLHMDELIVDNVSVYDRKEQLLTIKHTTNDKKRHFLIIFLQQPVLANLQYYVSIKYRGIINDLLTGFYRSSYSVGNQTRWIAATQFQATDARQAFPCFDEPALKARFQISLARPKHMNSISNMRKIGPPQQVDDLPDYVWDHYEESLPMSTYLVAFVISDFESITNGNFSVWTRHSALSQANYSLQIGPKLLKFYEDFFGIAYPLPKIDMVCLPDFSAGAMENWGLITYRESVLLYEPGVSSKHALQSIAHVMAHELAHQWFGNLVTPVWWSDLWLNEGFATYVETLGANAVNPELKEDDQFVINDLHQAFAMDALRSSHQISVKVNNPNEINDIFDSISYSKGAAILRMMQHFLTMEVFQRGLNRYLNSRMYRNAEQDDLWQILTQQSHEDHVLDQNLTIKQIMDTWTLQTGYPVLSVIRNYENISIDLYQKRFLISSDSEIEKELWWIPVTLTDINGAKKLWWMPPQRTFRIDYNVKSPRDWLLVNINQTGYYRVNYDQNNWNLIVQQLSQDHLVFDPKNRAQMLDDAMNLASIGDLSYDIALNITKYLKREREFVPWKAGLENLDFIYEMFVRTAHFDHFKRYMLYLIGDIYKTIGFNEFDTDDPLLAYSRLEIYSRACRLGVHDCLLNSVQQFDNWRNSRNPDLYNTIPVNMREIVYCTALRIGGQAEWDFAWQRYRNANVGNEKDLLLFALGCTRETWILRRYLEWAITENSGIRKHDSVRVFAAVAHNPIGQALAYKFLKTNWNQIIAYIGSSSMSLSGIVRSCTMNFNTQLEVDDFKRFLKEKENEIGIALRAAQQSLERNEFNVRWMDRNFETITKWLINNAN